MSEKNEVIIEIKKIIIPFLRGRGFEGCYPHFKRKNPEGFDLVSFQFNKWGGSFIIEMSVAYPERSEYKNCYLLGIKPYEEEIKTLNVINTFVRHRIKNKNDEWFDFTNEKANIVVERALGKLEDEISWYDKPNILKELKKRKREGLAY